MRCCRKLAVCFETAVMTLAGRLYGVQAIVRYLRIPNPRVSGRLLAAFGARIGRGVTFKRGIRIDNAYEDKNSKGDFRNLSIGDNCYIGDDVYFDLADEITIGNNVVVSGRASFVTHEDCNRSATLAAQFPGTRTPVKVRDGAWICFGATVLRGVTVGRNTVVAAHALLRSDAEDSSLYGGVPARLIRRLPEAAGGPLA